jgi:hypothetical protein
MERSNAQGFLQALAPLAIWFGTGYGVYTAWAAAQWATMAGLMVLHGTVGSTFVYGCHELGHGTVFKTKWLNTFFLHIYAFLFWWDPIDYSLSHTYHHRYSQFPAGDRENVFPLTPSLDPFLLLQLFTCNVFSTPGRVFGKGGMLSTIRLTFNAATGGIAAPIGTEQHEWLTAVRADQPVQVAKSIRFSQCVRACVFWGWCAACDVRCAAPPPPPNLKYYPHVFSYQSYLHAYPFLRTLGAVVPCSGVDCSNGHRPTCLHPNRVAALLLRQLAELLCGQHPALRAARLGARL